MHDCVGENRLHGSHRIGTSLVAGIPLLPTDIEELERLGELTPAQSTELKDSALESLCGEEGVGE